MSRILKLLAALVGLLLLLLAGLVFYITQLFDPNVLKPQLEKLARQQGVALHMPGNISWQWYPYLGLSLDKVQLGDEPLLAVEQLSARLEIQPLLQRRVVVKALTIVGLQLDLLRDAQGVANWETFIESIEQSQQATTAGAGAAAQAPKVSKSSPTEVAAPAAVASESLQLAIEELRFSAGTVRYRDLVAASTLQLTDLHLEVDNFSLAGEKFQLRHSARLVIEDLPAITLRTDGKLGVDLKKQHVAVDKLDLDLNLDGRPLAITLAGEVDLEPLAPTLAFKLAPFDLASWLQGLQISLPPMAAGDALQRLAVNATVSGTSGSSGGSNWKLGDLSLQLDDSRFTGQLLVSDSGALNLTLRGDQLNLDRYLAAEIEPPPAAAAGGPLPDEQLDLSALQSLQARLDLSIDQLQAAQLVFSDARLSVAAAAGQVSLSQFSAGFYQGDLNLTALLDARQPQAAVSAQGQVKNIAVKPLLEILASEARLSGQVSGTWNASTSGKRVSELQNNLGANLELSASSMLLAEVDLERSACELAALVNTAPTPELQWQGATRLQDIKVQVALKGEQVNVQSLQAGVENLALAGKGKLDYGSGSFEFPLEVMFVGDVDATRKCQVRERWRNKPLPLRCKGNLNALSARTCLPDHKRLDDLLRDELKDRAQDKVKEKLEKKLGTEKGEAVDQLLRGIFKR